MYALEAISNCQFQYANNDINIIRQLAYKDHYHNIYELVDE